MHYQLFIADVRGADPQHLVGVGLGDFVSGAEFLDVAPDRSPIERGGVLVAWRRPGANEIGFLKERQRWVPAVQSGDLAAGRYWLGFWNDHPLTPADLKRPYQYRGHSMELGDGETWLIPEAHKLPHDMILQDDGSYRFELQRHFHDYGLDVQAAIERLSENDMQYSPVDAANLIARALRLNYRFTPEVQNELRLINTANIEHAYLASLGLLREARA